MSRLAPSRSRRAEARANVADVTDEVTSDSSGAPVERASVAAGAGADGPAETTGKDLAGHGAKLGLAMILANGANYVLNVALGRWLTPAEFADANLAVTLMLLITAVAVSLQLIAARFVGLRVAEGRADEVGALAGWLERRALAIGAVVGLGLALAAGTLADVFRVASPDLFWILGLGMPFYLAQAVGRGVLQGELRFTPLALSFAVEAVVRVGAGLGLVAAGYGVAGATWALTISFVALWVLVRSMNRGWSRSPMAPGTVRSIVAYAGPVAVLLLGQIIVNNGDVLISKRALDGDTAGVYAAVALVGRAVFFLSWSVATTIFPAVAQRSAGGRTGDELVHGGLLAVGALGTAAVAGSWLLGGPVLGVVFGPAYGDVSGPLGWYALATSLFALANLLASHHLALGRLRESALIVAGGIVQTALLWFNQSSIDSLVQAQVVAMSLLVVMVGVSHWRRLTSSSAITGGVS